MPRRILLPAALLALGAAALGAQQPKTAPHTINRPFENPDPSDYVKRFETESREVYARRGEIAAALGLTPGMAVADVGAGTGFFARLFAERVGPRGTVFAVDVAPTFLKHIAAEAERRRLDQIVPVLGTQHSTHLPAESVDLAFICDVYHHFEDPAGTLASIHRALRPGGRLVVVEFDRVEGKSSKFVLEHVRADKETFLREIRAAGFEPIPLAQAPRLTETFMAGFRKVASPARPADRDGPAPGRAGR